MLRNVGSNIVAMKRGDQGAFHGADIAQLLPKNSRWSEVAVDDVECLCLREKR